MKCSSDKILNPKTGRCVLKSGKIGKDLLKNRRSTPKQEPSSNVKSEKTEKLEKEVKSLKQAYENALRNLQKCNANFYDLKQKYEISIHKSAHSHKQDHHSERKKASAPFASDKEKAKHKEAVEKMKKIQKDLGVALGASLTVKEERSQLTAELHKLGSTIEEKKAELEKVNDKYESVLALIKDSKRAAGKKADSKDERIRSAQQVAINDAKRRIGILETKLDKAMLTARLISKDIETIGKRRTKLEKEIREKIRVDEKLEKIVDERRRLYKNASKNVDELLAEISR